MRKDLRFLLLPFHAWEFSIVGIALVLGVWSHPLFIAAVLGHLGHIVTDQIANSMHPMAYSLVYRIYRRFDRTHLAGEKMYPFSRVLAGNVPLYRQFSLLAMKIKSRIQEPRK